MPAFSLQPVCLEHGLDHTVGEVVQIERPANRIREHPAGGILGLDGIEHEPKGLDDWNDTGVFIVLMGFGLILKMSPPHRASDVKNVPVVVFPPLPSNLALTQASKCRHTNDRPDDTLSNFGSVRAVLGGDDNGLRVREKLKVLFHFVKSIGNPSLLPTARARGSFSDFRTHMRKELEQRLVERWTRWFNVGGDFRHTSMPRGFTHADGWFDILWRLCEDLEPLVAKFEQESGRQFEVLQVKEKFGQQSQQRQVQNEFRLAFESLLRKND